VHIPAQWKIAQFARETPAVELTNHLDLDAVLWLKDWLVQIPAHETASGAVVAATTVSLPREAFAAS